MQPLLKSDPQIHPVSETVKGKLAIYENASVDSKAGLRKVSFFFIHLSCIFHTKFNVFYMPLKISNVS